MANYTEHYNLEKPEKTDYYDVETANKNNDIIDNKLYEKQDKQPGKGLSTNDFTNKYKEKLDALQRIYKYCGSVETINDLNTIEEKQRGDVYNVNDINVDYCWNETEWTALGNAVDLSNYQTTEEAEQEKQQIEEEIAQIQEDLNTCQEGTVPQGGIIGQVLAKKSNTDYDTEWVDNNGDVKSDVLPKAETKTNTSDSTTIWADVQTGGLLNRSGFYTVQDANGWYNLFNLRHRNGTSDGTSYGMQISKAFDVNSALNIRSQNEGDWNNWETLPRYSLLHSSSGLAGTITLSETSANFKYLEIFCTKDDASGVWSVKVPTPNGQKAQIGITYTNGDVVQVIGKTVTIIEDIITQNDEGYANILTTSPQVSDSGKQSSVLIVRVIGWR